MEQKRPDLAQRTNYQTLQPEIQNKKEAAEKCTEKDPGVDDVTRDLCELRRYIPDNRDTAEPLAHVFDRLFECLRCCLVARASRGREGVLVRVL